MVRVCIDDDTNPLVRCQQVAHLLAKFTKLQSLGLYYLSGSTDTTLLAESIVRLMENGQLDTLGIYSDLVTGFYPQRTWDSLPVNAPMAILEAILTSDKCSDALRVLDLTSESMSQDVYDRICSGLKNLSSLSIHRSFRYRLGDLWEPNTRLKWSPKTNLTQLHLINCQNAYAPHIPGFIKHFDSIRELWVVECGHGSDVPPPTRSRGWSEDPHAIWRVRAPLDEFLIEHMDDWEILALGPIPTKRLLLHSMGQRPILRPLCRDPEVFPGMGVLLTVRGEPNEIPSLLKDETDNTVVTLEIFCKERGIEWRKSAHRLRYCSAVCCEGQYDDTDR